MGKKKKPMIEITAAVDDLPKDSAPVASGYREKNRIITGKTSCGTQQHSAPAAKGSFRHVVDDNLEDLLQVEPPTDSVGQPLFPHAVEPKDNSAEKKESAPKDAELYDEVRLLRSMINGLSGQLEEALTRKMPSRQKVTPIIAKERATTKTPAQKNPPLRQLLERGISPETARTLAKFLQENYSKEELIDDQEITAKLVETIESLVEVAPPQFDSCKKQQRIAFVGPTGVGKTTTLAKVCAHYLATKSKSVALITIDTYRIAAVEQLKIYGEIMGLPVDVVFTPEQMEEALARHQDKELILIDTAGRNPRDSFNIDELATFLTPEMDIEKHLVLSAATREREKLGLARTVFTKLDECFTLGTVLNIQLQNPAPLSWLTNGQRVPEDLVHISPRKVAELIMIDNKASA